MVIFAADMGKIIVAGIGPGSKEDITPAVLEAVREADGVVGYKYYFQFIEAYIKEGCECIDTGMKKERERAEQAFLRVEATTIFQHRDSNLARHLCIPKGSLIIRCSHWP